MIVFDLICGAGGHRFEGWFASNAAFDEQTARALVACPQCGSSDIGKALMAPNVGRKGNQLATMAKPPVPTPMAKLPPQVHEAMAKLAEMQTMALQQSTWVGDQFAAQSRAIHYGEREEATIHGQATVAEAEALVEEGIAVMPLPFPVAPPDEVN